MSDRMKLLAKAYRSQGVTLLSATKTKRAIDRSVPPPTRDPGCVEQAKAQPSTRVRVQNALVGATPSRTVPHTSAPSRTVPHTSAPSRTVPHTSAPSHAATHDEAAPETKRNVGSALVAEGMLSAVFAACTVQLAGVMTELDLAARQWNDLRAAARVVIEVLKAPSEAEEPR